MSAGATSSGLDGEKYISLVTFRKDGREVATPVWFVETDGGMYAYTRTESAKVRRLRNNPAARVAPCTMRGDPTGPYREASAREIIDGGQIAAVFAAMARKYGWAYRLASLAAWLGGNAKNRAVLEISLNQGTA